MNTFGQYGYASPAGTRTLVADLTPPLHHGSEVALELLQHGDELWGYPTNFGWKWEVAHGSTRTTKITQSERFTCAVPAESDLKISCTLQNQGKDTDISAEFQFACKPGPYTAYWQSDVFGQKAIVELVHDLKPYIEIAAKGTGKNGVSARFIAGVLLIEISNRPRVDRQPEIEEVREEIAELEFERHRKNFFDQFNLNYVLPRKSFGVGQMKMSTLAMALGMIPLIEHDRNNRDPSISRINDEFMKLTTEQMWHLWKTIRWPKSNIDGVAKILAFLKNRSKRYPNLGRADFLTNRRAMEIVATEYHLGATTTGESLAVPDEYGKRVARTCLDPRIEPQIFSNFSHV